MAVKDGVSYYPTERLISKSSRKHFRIPVRSQHWQLRSLISVEKQDVVYFPGGSCSNHIQRLDVTTNECETVKLLSFSPRCLVAQNGWVCCGGETGEFTAIKLRESRTTDDATDLDVRLNDLEADSRLPLSFESFRSEVYGSSSRMSRLQSTLEKNLMAKSKKLARDRVNCVTMWFPQENVTMPVGHYKDPVAVLANNDKTVVLVGLNNFESEEKPEPLDVVVYPDYVNRSVLSPDGRLLISILDDPYLYVHRRVAKRVDDQSSVRSRDGAQFHWEECNKVILKSQRRGDSSDSRGSFAACFSSSGAYLAVGTQYGTISVFETQYLTDPAADPLLTSFTSSRPMAGWGAVRDMAFCPGPYDLLAWTEDRGRVGVADVRSGFSQQQILDISADGDFEHVTILDRDMIDPRLLEGRGERNDNSSSSLLSSANSLNDIRRRRNLGERHGLSQDETMVLEALQVERRRREQTDRIAARLADHSNSTNSNSLASIPWEVYANRASGTAEDDSAARGSRERSSSVARALRELQRDRDERSNIARALTDWLRESRDRNQRAAFRASERAERVRGDRDAQVLPPLPRRTTTLRPAESAAQSPRSAAGTRSGLTSSGGWADLEALYNITLESNNSGSSGTEARETARDTTQPETTQRDRESERDRDRSGFLPFINSVAIREMDSRLAQRRTGMDASVHESPPEPDNTAGISWSEDGRVLYVGAENGIYEFRVNTQGRKYCPNVTLR